jgi:peptide deformylase
MCYNKQVRDNKKMRIYHLYNSDDEKILRAVNSSVQSLDEVTPYLDEMFNLMHKSGGVGLAAPQVGINKCFFIAELEDGKPLVFINPQITATSVQTTLTEEGCLSLAGLYTKVLRPQTVSMQALNERFRPFVLEASGFLATCLQHEYDHLQGKLFIDYFNDTQRELLLKRYQKITEKRLKNEAN